MNSCISSISKLSCQLCSWSDFVRTIVPFAAHNRVFKCQGKSHFVSNIFFLFCFNFSFYVQGNLGSNLSLTLLQYMLGK